MFCFCVIHVFWPTAFDVVHAFVSINHGRGIRLVVHFGSIRDQMRLDIVLGHVGYAIRDGRDWISMNKFVKVIFIGPKIGQHNGSLLKKGFMAFENGRTSSTKRGWRPNSLRSLTY